MSLSKLLKSAKYLGPYVKITDLTYKYFLKNEQDANKIYRSIQPTLNIVFLRYGRDSKQFISHLEVLLALTPVGVKRRNFEKKYIRNRQGWRQLPDNPKDIMFGYWW